MEIFQDGEMEEELRRREFRATSLSCWWQLFATSYDEVIKSIAYPPRAQYLIGDLGENEFALDSGEGCVREDLTLRNPRNEELQCSFWYPVSASTTSAPLPCIVYLHGLSSSRQECVYLRRKVLAAGFSLFTLDLSGSGQSDGDRVSFGHFEQGDVRAVVDYLYATNRASSVGLWGRCIGGSAALLFMRDAMTTRYRTLTITKNDVSHLKIRHCPTRNQMMCARSRFRRHFRRCSDTDITAIDFVVLAVGDTVLGGAMEMDSEALRSLMDRSSGDTITLRGYELDSCNPSLWRQDNEFVFGMALDSTFGDMQQVITDMLSEVASSARKRELHVPETMLKAASKVIGHSVHKSAGYHFADINVLDDVDMFATPCVFVTASKKDFISPAHTIAIREHYGGEKKHVSFQGAHDQNRPDMVLDAICTHFQETLKAVRECRPDGWLKYSP